MSVLLSVWSRIATKLYLALGIAVVLTLLSAGVGVFHFELSGDLNHRVETEAVPALQGMGEVSRSADRLGSLGALFLADARAGRLGPASWDVDGLLSGLEGSLARPAGLPGLEEEAAGVHDAAFTLAEVVDRLEVDRTAAADQSRLAGEVFSALSSEFAQGGGAGVVMVLAEALRAPGPGRSGGPVGQVLRDGAPRRGCPLPSLPGGVTGDGRLRPEVRPVSPIGTPGPARG